MPSAERKKRVMEALERVGMAHRLRHYPSQLSGGQQLGLGGILTIVPDLSILAGITLRTVQKLSLLYGFEYNTDEETAELWVAAASAAGVDVSRELLDDRKSVV